VRVEDAAASGCQLDEHKKIASELAAEEDYNLRSPFFLLLLFLLLLLPFGREPFCVSSSCPSLYVTCLPGQIRLRLARPANATVLQRYINMVGDSPEMVGVRRCSVPLSVCRTQPEGWARSPAGNSGAAASPVQP